MNDKKAKKLRQLTRHLIARAETTTPWVKYDQRTQTIPNPGGEALPPILIPVGTRKLSKDCGRAVYQAMKARASA